MQSYGIINQCTYIHFSLSELIEMGKQYFYQLLSSVLIAKGKHNKLTMATVLEKVMLLFTQLNQLTAVISWSINGF